MRKLCLLVASLLAGLMLSSIPTFADASQNGCEHSDGKANGCSSDPAPATTAPEPGSLALLATGILVIGGSAAVLWRRRFLHN